MTAVHHSLGVAGSYPLLVALWLLPLAGAIVCWAFGPRLKTLCGWLGSGVIAASFVLAVLSWGDGTQHAGNALGAHQPLFSWIAGTFDFGLLLDPLSLLWTLIITGVGFLIHLYSIGYMDGDRAFARFFAYMNFFVFAMLTLVLSDNFVGLLVGWGLVGLASYFLIGFWFERRTAVAAARKAFVINVVGDVGIMFAVFALVASDTLGRRSATRLRRLDRSGRRCSSASASRSSSAPPRSRRRFRCTPGFPTRWKARRRSRR